MTPSGEFRHRVTIQKPAAVRTRDAGGREVPTFDDVAVVPARIRELSGRSAFIAAQREQESSHEIAVRYMPALADINGSWRIVFGSRVFVQTAPARNIDELSREIVLTCAEGMRTQ